MQKGLGDKKLVSHSGANDMLLNNRLTAGLRRRRRQTKHGTCNGEALFSLFLSLSLMLSLSPLLLSPLTRFCGVVTGDERGKNGAGLR